MFKTITTKAVLRSALLLSLAASASACDRGEERISDLLIDCQDAECVAELRSGSSRPEIFVGGTHTCALYPSGDVRCWGYANMGQLGYGNTEQIGDDEDPSSVGFVDVGGTVSQLALGGYHTCALLDAGAVRCWGSGSYGELGYGNTQRVGDDETPASVGDVPVGGTAVQITAGTYSTCALLDTGNVRCWGSHGSGRLGYGISTNGNVGDGEPAGAFGDVPVGGAVVKITSGDRHTCALLDTGAVRCWGYNGYGQLGYGHKQHIGDNETPASQGDIDVGGTVVDIGAGTYHTCALLDTGDVRCWGYNHFGYLGYNHNTQIGDDELPTADGPVQLIGDAEQLSVGRYHTCALVDGDAQCWGRGVYGILGYGNTKNYGSIWDALTTQTVHAGGRIEAIHTSGSSMHSCVTLEGGDVRCWGPNWYGQLGYGHKVGIGDNELPSSQLPVAL